MINNSGKSRIKTKNIISQIFLIESIANNMKKKYKNVFNVINYSDNSLKSDIKHLIEKSIENNDKDINIKYIETTILNKIRAKYKAVKFNIVKQNETAKFIKIIHSIPNKSNSYLDISKTNQTLSVKRKKRFLNKPQPIQIKLKDYDKNYIKNINIKNKDKSINTEQISKKYNDNIIKFPIASNDTIKERIKLEEDKIKKLENYKLRIQQEIQLLNQELNKEEDNKSQEQKNIIDNLPENENNIKEQNSSINYLNKSQINESSNLTKTKDELFQNFNPSISYETLRYLERKKRIQEDVHNKQNRYIFLKPKIYKMNDKLNESMAQHNNFKFHNIKINKYSMDLLNKKKQSEKSDKSKSLDEKKLICNMPLEDKIKLRILQRTIEQEKAIENLRNILFPGNKLMAESDYQGFNSIYNTVKKDKYEIADEARRCQIEKMKKMLNYSFMDRDKRKEEEKKMDIKYREMIDRDYEEYLEKEKQNKLKKSENFENYRKLLDEQIKGKQELLDAEKNKDFELFDL